MTSPARQVGPAKRTVQGFSPGSPAAQQRRAVGHLDARPAYGRRRWRPKSAIVVSPFCHHIQHTGQEIPRVQGAGLAGFKIDRHAPIMLGATDATFQRGHVVAGAGDVMPAAKVQPLYSGAANRRTVSATASSVTASASASCSHEGVEMQTVQQLRQRWVRRHRGIPLPATGRAQAAAGGAGIVDRVAVLGRALGVDAQARRSSPPPWPPGRTLPAGAGELNTMWSAYRSSSFISSAR